MKIRDRDLKKIKIDMYLNETLWFRGIRNPPARIRVRAIRKGDLVRVELVEMVEKENKAAVVEEGKNFEKDSAKQSKHLVGGKTKQPKHRQRKALEK